MSAPPAATSAPAGLGGKAAGSQRRRPKATIKATGLVTNCDVAIQPYKPLVFHELDQTRASRPPQAAGGGVSDEASWVGRGYLAKCPWPAECCYVTTLPDFGPAPPAATSAPAGFGGCLGPGKSGSLSTARKSAWRGREFKLKKSAPPKGEARERLRHFANAPRIAKVPARWNRRREKRGRSGYARGTSDRPHPRRRSSAWNENAAPPCAGHRSTYSPGLPRR